MLVFSSYLMIFNSHSRHARPESLKNLKRQYKEKGVVPRTHGLKGTRPHNAYPFEVEVRNRLQFLSCQT